MKKAKKAIVVGSGAGGATAAKELQGKFDVTVLEAGNAFKPFGMSLSALERFKKAGLYLDERQIRLLFPAMMIRKTPDRMVLVNGACPGGSTTLSAGNALRMDDGLKKLGIDLDAEFEELYHEIPVTADHMRNWRETTRRLFEICREMGLGPQPTPKMGEYDRCCNCGQCVLGCRSGAKWDSRRFLESALDKGAHLITGCSVKKIVIQNGRVTGVQAKTGLRTTFHPADLVILAAGGLATPVILQNSGVECQNTLFVDPVLCVAAEWKGCLQNKEIAMPFVVQKDRFILSPYFDHLSFFFNKDWRYPAKDTLSLMIKLKDTNAGGIEKRKGKINKVLSDTDKQRLNEGVEICAEIHSRLGIKKDSVFLGTINAGHPGGMLPLTKEEALTFHNPRLPENLYVADATLFPGSLGNPPIFTIMAMAKRVCKLCY